MNLNVYVKDEIFNQIDNISKTAYISKKDIVNTALTNWLDNYKKQQCIDIIKNMEVIKDFDELDNIRIEMNKTEVDEVK